MIWQETNKASFWLAWWLRKNEDGGGRGTEMHYQRMGVGLGTSDFTPRPAHFRQQYQQWYATTRTTETDEEGEVLLTPQIQS